VKRLVVVSLLFLAAPLGAQTESGPYARIAVLRPHDGETVDFEAGYIRHLEWHRQAQDKSIWYGWTVWAGERQRSFVYATFGHSAESLSNPVAPHEDERDNIVNVAPHAQFTGNAVYEYLPSLSRGSGVPTLGSRVEMTTIELVPGAERLFEEVLATDRSRLQDETLWYRMIAGGGAPRYVRLRPRANLAAILEQRSDLPYRVSVVIAKITIEILALRPAMSYGVAP